MKALSGKFGKIFFVFCMVVVAGIVLPAGAAEVTVEVVTGDTAGYQDPQASPAPDAVGNTKVRIASLPLSFIPNRGQYDPAVAFVVTGPDSTLFFAENEIVITAEERNGSGPVSRVVRQTFLGASLHPVITGADPLPGTANFFTGNDPSKWQAGVPTYGAVEYHDLYPRIELRYRGTEGTLKREFIVLPGADPSVIRLRYEGVDSVAVDENGALVLTTGTRTLTESPLVCYQEINSNVVPVRGAYRVLNDQDVAFALGPYDPAFPLIIDPRLVYSTYLGGSDNDEGYGIAVDTSGSVYMTGETDSEDFPTTAGAYDRTMGYDDVVVMKLNPAGSGLIYSTFLGGSDSDDDASIAVDGSGNAYVSGHTGSSDFPTTPGAYNRSGPNSFVTKLNATGSGLVYSTLLGGSYVDAITGIAVDGSGRAYVTGYTLSSDFPTTAGAYDLVNNGGWSDAFVTKVNAAGSGLLYSTYLGGEGEDRGNDIAVDGIGNAYVTGSTNSTGFPTTGTAYDRTKAGLAEHDDAFVTKLNAAGSDLTYSTYLGGPENEVGNGIAVDGSRNAYVTGQTLSSLFPTTAEAFDRKRSGSDAFVTKLNAGGSGLVYSTFLGGSDSDMSKGIAVDGSGNAYIGGWTHSDDFPTTAGAYNRSIGFGEDVFVTKLNAAGSGLGYSSYLGGEGQDFGYAIAVDGSGNAYETGYTSSEDFPTTASAYDITYDGYNDDAFVAKFSLSHPGMVGVYRPLIQSFILKNGTEKTVVPWGLSTDTPVSGDWNGDGMDDVGMYRPSIHSFILDNGTDKTVVAWGLETDTPVTGDWNGDGLGDVGVYRSSIHSFILKNGTEKTVVPWGLDADLPVSGDWNGDGPADVGVYRPSIHSFILKNGTAKTVVPWGLSTDIPVSGDWNDDGLWDVGVYRSSIHSFILKNGTAKTVVPWGLGTDIPVTGRWS